MNWKLEIYKKLVNNVPGIRERYQTLRENGTNRFIAWGYVLLLNFLYHVLQQKKLGSALCTRDDTNIRLRSDICESSLTSHKTQEELAATLSKYDIISFDVFDTLILRPFQEPADVFFLLEQRLEYPGLKTIRQKAEQEIRVKENHYEVTLEEIWDRVEEISGICKKTGLQAEVEIEKECCYANPYFLPVIEQLRNAGKKLVICSDMYLGKERIAGLLKKCGYVGFDDYFISCDEQKSKSDGSLYHVIRRQYGADKTYAHIGDNKISDFQKAKEALFYAVLYENVNKAGYPYRPKDMSPVVASVYGGIVNAHLHNGLTNESALYEFGFIYGGLLVAGYCQFIHDYIEKNQIERILFFSRDGDIVKRVYTLMYPEHVELCEYVYWSRLVAMKLSASYYKQVFIERMIDHKINLGYTVKEIFHTMELDDMIERFCSGNDVMISEQTKLNKNTATLMKKFLYQNWNEVLHHYEKEVQLGGEYYRKKLKGAKSAVCVDVGWVGTGAISLRYLAKHVWNLDCELTGLLIGTASSLSHCSKVSETELATKHLISYLFSSAHNRDIWKTHDDVKGHNLLVELLLSSPTPPFYGFSEQGLCFGEKKEKVDSREIQHGILDFVGFLLKHPFKNLTISGRDAAAPITVLYHNEEFVSSMIKKAEIRAEVEQDSTKKVINSGTIIS